MAFSKHLDDVGVSEWAFKALVALSLLDDNKQSVHRHRFYVVECFDCCSRSLKENAADEKVAEWGLRALITLTPINAAGRANAVKLGATACASIAAALVPHINDVTIVTLACEAISNIAVNSSNKSSFGSNGCIEACTQVCLCVYLHMKFYVFF